MDEADRVEKLLRAMDKVLRTEGWHDDGPAIQVWYVHEQGKRLVAKPAKLPPLDQHPTLTATEVLFEIALKTRQSGFYLHTYGIAVSYEAWLSAEPSDDAPVHVRDQWDAARVNRGFHLLPDSTETRVIALVLRNGTEGVLTRYRGGGRFTVSVEPQAGLTFRTLRLIMGLPEADPVRSRKPRVHD